MTTEEKGTMIFQKLQHLKYMSKFFTEVLPGSRSERVLKMKLEKELQGLKALGADAGIVFMVLNETGNLINLPISLEWRIAAEKKVHLP